MSLYSRLFPKAAELEKANKRIEVLEADRAELTKRNSKLWESYNSHDAALQKARTELSEVKGKLREQTDADLLLVSARIIQATLRGEKPNSEDVVRQQQLSALQQSLRPYDYYSGQANMGMLGGLGLAAALALPANPFQR